MLYSHNAMTSLDTRKAVLALAAVAALFTLPAFTPLDGFVSGDAWRTNDWLNTRLFDLLAHDSLLGRSTFPLRSHLVGGGFPTVAHPSDGSWAPTLPVILALGPVLGTKVLLTLFLFLGGLGVFLCARDLLRLSTAASLAAGLLMVVSGWAPSMILVGFWNQVFSLLGPLILWCLLTGGARRLLLGGFLLAMVLQQGGHAFSALCVSLGLCTVAAAAVQSRRPLMAAGGVLLLTAPLAIAQVGQTPLVALVCLGGPFVLLRDAELREALVARVGRLVVLLGTALLLGAGRLAGLFTINQLGGRYGHALSRHDALWFPIGRPFSLLPADVGDRGTESFRGGQFYELDFLLQGLAGRVPAAMPYRQEFGRLGSPMDYEYAWLGLTFAGLVLAGFGIAWALGRERRAEHRALVVMTIIFAAICLGPNLPPDLHFLVVGGLPLVGDLAQPLKYWNVFLLVALCLCAGLTIERAEARAGALGVGLACLLLVFPAWQNHQMLDEAFSEPRPRLEPTEQYRQRSLIDDLGNAAVEPARIARDVEAKRLREYRRAPGATEWDLALAGEGLVSWYGTLELPERAVPDVWVTPEGETAQNPASKGPVWFEGQGELLEWEIAPNTLRAWVRAPVGGFVMFSQETLEIDDWVVEGGELFDVNGLLGVRVKGGKDGEVSLTYRPRWILRGLTVSGVSFAGWLFLMAVLPRRRP